MIFSYRNEAKIRFYLLLVIRTLSLHFPSLCTWYREDMAENDSIVANRSCGYCLEFDVGKKKSTAPKCVMEYCNKPWPSEALLRERQHKAALRRKVK